MPMTKPAITPALSCAAPVNSGCPAVASCPSTSTMAMAMSTMAMTLYNVADFRRIAQPAPNHAPSRLPASRLPMITQLSAIGRSPCCCSHRSLWVGLEQRSQDQHRPPATGCRAASGRSRRSQFSERPCHDVCRGLFHALSASFRIANDLCREGLLSGGGRRSDNPYRL